MIASAVTRDFGLIASDSAQYDTSQGKMSFQSLKLFFTQRYLLTFIGTPAYFAKIDRSKFDKDLHTATIYLKDYLQKMKPEVTKTLTSEIADEDENKPNFCLFLLGVHKGLPTMTQFNSFKNFEPRYLYNQKEGVKFSTIYYGDDNPKKKEIFTQATEFMEKKAADLKATTPGILGEVLTRGIYKKADLEMKLEGKKYAGGVVNVAGITKGGIIFPLSGLNAA